MVVCGTHHPLVGQTGLALEDLAGETWLPNTVGSAARQRHEQLLEAQGWALRASTIVTRISALTWTLLDSGRLLTLVPYSVVRPWVERQQLQVLPVHLNMPFEPVGMLMPRQGMSRAGQVMARFVIDRIPW